MTYFKVGGTLHLDSPSYVKRAADARLFQQVMAGQLCYVLTTRQMGKSSLMVRTAARLNEVGVRTADVDLSAIGTQGVRAGQWYLGILETMVQKLKLPVVAQAWWDGRGTSGVVQRFSDFIREVVLTAIDGRMVIFFDEIDSTLSLDFTDDFFAAVRSMYNERATDPAYDRLTFVLLGVASPASLIKEANRTPFNVGSAIDLAELSRNDAMPLADGLERSYPNQGGALLDRVFFWTNGHPYLTQRVCDALVNREITSDPATGPIEQRVDQTVRMLFLSQDAKPDDNLQFVRSRVEASQERRPLLQLYRRIYQGTQVSEDERSILQNELKLIGLIAPRQGMLQVRNQIYRRVFTLDWVKQNTPINWANLVTVGGIVVAVAAIVTVILFQGWQTNRQINLLRAAFRSTSSPNVQMVNLAGICTRRTRDGQELFATLPLPDQIRLFEEVDVKVVDKNLLTVVDCLRPTLAPPPSQLSNAICSSLQKHCTLNQLPVQREPVDRCGCEK